MQINFNVLKVQFVKSIICGSILDFLISLERGAPALSNGTKNSSINHLLGKLHFLLQLHPFFVVCAEKVNVYLFLSKNIQN